MRRTRVSHRASATQKPRVRQLRRNMTWPERKLWSMLRNRRLGDAKFRRQQVIGPFIVDFVWIEARLIIEVDGDTHIGRGERDQHRDALLQNSGFRVLRVTNDDVIHDFDAVLEEILRSFAFDFLI